MSLKYLRIFVCILGGFSSLFAFSAEKPKQENPVTGADQVERADQSKSVAQAVGAADQMERADSEASSSKRQASRVLSFFKRFSYPESDKSLQDLSLVKCADRLQMASDEQGKPVGFIMTYASSPVEVLSHIIKREELVEMDCNLSVQIASLFFL